MTEDRKKRLLGYGCLLLILVISLCLTAPKAPGPTDPVDRPPNSSSSENTQKATVRIYTCDQELYLAFTQLAEEYKAQTGVLVDVMMAGTNGCQSSLETAMGREDAPTILCLHSQEDMEKWKDSLYNLAGSQLLDQLCAGEFAMGMDGKLLAITADTQGYGLIYNASLLAMAGFTRSDITNFAALETITDFIADKDLTYGAFSSPDFSDASHRGLACLLAGTHRDPAQLRSFLSLYSQKDPSGDGLQEFLQEEAVFYVGGSWDYEKVASLGSHNLDIMPAYSEQGGSLQYISTLCWGVNGNMPQNYVQDSLDFLLWLVTAGEDGSAPVDQLELLAPFRDAAYYADPLEKKLRGYMETETVQVAWDCCPNLNEQELQTLCQSLAAYVAKPDEETWQQVLDALN